MLLAKLLQFYIYLFLSPQCSVARRGRAICHTACASSHERFWILSWSFWSFFCVLTCLLTEVGDGSPYHTTLPVSSTINVLSVTFFFILLFYFLIVLLPILFLRSLFCNCLCVLSCLITQFSQDEDIKGKCQNTSKIVCLSSHSKWVICRRVTM